MTDVRQTRIQKQSLYSFIFHDIIYIYQSLVFSFKVDSSTPTKSPTKYPFIMGTDMCLKLGLNFTTLIQIHLPSHTITYQSIWLHKSHWFKEEQKNIIISYYWNLTILFTNNNIYSNLLLVMWTWWQTHTASISFSSLTLTFLQVSMFISW